MAEIRVEPRKKASIWPWIVGLLILLGLIWVLVEAFGSEEEYDEDSTEEVIEETNEVGHQLNTNEQLWLTLYA